MNTSGARLLIAAGRWGCDAVVILRTPRIGWLIGVLADLGRLAYQHIGDVHCVFRDSLMLLKCDGWVFDDPQQAFVEMACACRSGTGRCVQEVEEGDEDVKGMIWSLNRGVC